MNPAHRQAITNIPHICAQHGVQDAILSPGSRSAPLTVAFARHPGLRCRVVFDERSAAYLALGLAQQTGRPAVLVCTSGTAALNYAPAVAEAFYQGVPLLLFTADRPPEWIDQQDNQTIHQRGLYEPHVQGSFQLPVDASHPDAAWELARTLSQAINRSRHPLPGPVQVNVPLREPLYPEPGEPSRFQEVKRIQERTGQPMLGEAAWQELLAAWQGARRKLLLAGQQPPDPGLLPALEALSRRPGVAVAGDLVANLFPEAGAEGPAIQQGDAILTDRSSATRSALAPDLLITWGGPLVSKSLKLFLREQRPGAHWHVQPWGDAPDTFQALTQVVRMAPAAFLRELAERVATLEESQDDPGYGPTWRRLQAEARARTQDFLEAAPFGEFQAVQRVLQALPPGSHLQLGNSMPVRYANLVGRLPGMAFRRVDANRGVSGIDGTVSTAVGAALALQETGRLVTLLVGDLAFFYDRNGLWHHHLPANLRIVLLNNHGGGIFTMIPGPGQLAPEERERYFVTPQPLTARRTAADHGCEYVHCRSGQELAERLPAFFQESARPRILEIETDREVNTQVYTQFKERLQGLTRP